ncbi:MAG: orotidine 5'-phosphate decarboxylase [Candidatus Bathyarchaeota archaeon]|nr:orotidine 5'-phosphate decarboxylase [Candidatus Bathyarchaeota archaeon]
MSFKQQMEAASKTKQSSIVLALDFPYQPPSQRADLLQKALGLLEAVNPHICAVKINHHLTLPLGLFDGIQKIVSAAHSYGLPAIMDCKANDIGATNTVIAKYYFEAGFDVLIANPFIGWEEGLKPIFDEANAQNRGVILLTYMSHKGASQGYGQTIQPQETNSATKQYLSFARAALEYGASGAVVGATVPEKIREIHKVLQDTVPIYSPGVGAQGGAALAAVEAGARYLIIGREITNSQNPEESARKLKNSLL